MMFTGVDVVDGSPRRWRVENSWDDKVGNKGFFLMNDSWFAEYMFEIAVPKDYLPPHAAWPIMYEKNYGRIVFTSSGSGIWGNFGQSNYGAAKMGMLGLMNVLALEGASHNIKTNVLAPGAATRMTSDLPGRDTFDPDEPPPERAPSLVTPAVIYMCSEEAPTGRVFQAASGNFSTAAMYANAGVRLGESASFETFLENLETITDMSKAEDGVARRQRQRAERSS